MMGDRSLISTWEQDIILAHMSEGDRIRPLHKPGNSDFGPVLGKKTRKLLLGKNLKKACHLPMANSKREREQL